jgi:hypothetical protein
VALRTCSVFYDLTFAEERALFDRLVVPRHIVAERVLGLPGGPRVDRDGPWRDIPR